MLGCMPVAGPGRSKREREMTVEAEAEGPTADNVSANENLVGAPPSGYKLHQLSPSHDKPCCAKWKEQCIIRRKPNTESDHVEQ